MAHMRDQSRRPIGNALIWLAFAGAFAIATAPVWRQGIFGFDPTLDQLLQLSICGGVIK
jgi:hypothetical protein